MPNRMCERMRNSTDFSSLKSRYNHQLSDILSRDTVGEALADVGGIAGATLKPPRIEKCKNLDISEWLSQRRNRRMDGSIRKHEYERRHSHLTELFNLRKLGDSERQTGRVADGLADRRCEQLSRTCSENYSRQASHSWLVAFPPNK